MRVGTSKHLEVCAKILVFTYLAAPKTTGYERNRRCDCPIPGTTLYAGVYYKIFSGGKHARFSGGHLIYSSRVHTLGHLYVGTIDTSKNKTFMNNDSVPTAFHWRFVETEFHGWYYLQNKNHPDKYVTWSLEYEDNLFGSAKSLVLDPNYPGKHRRMDFFVQPYRPEGVDTYHHQIKFKNAPVSVVTWSSFGSNTDFVPIQLDLRKQENLRYYERGNEWFEDTLFKFRKVNENNSSTSSTVWINMFSWVLVWFTCGVTGLFGKIVTFF